MCLVSVQDAEMLYLYKPKFQTKLYNYKFHQRSYHFFIIMFTFKKVRFSLQTPLIKNNESNNVHNYLKILQLQHSDIQQVVRVVVGLYGVATVVVICLAQRWIPPSIHLRPSLRRVSIFHPSQRWISILYPSLYPSIHLCIHLPIFVSIYPSLEMDTRWIDG